MSTSLHVCPAMTRRKPPPDLRPSWRDPNMPVLLTCTNQDTGQNYLREYTPERAQYAFAWRMENGTNLVPDWRNDPTYHMRRRPQP